MTTKSGPAWTSYPEHRITTTPFRGPVQVAVGGEVIANTSDAVALEEAMGGSTVAPVVYYIPRKDVKMERLVRTSHQTYCPFKGDASYYSVVDGSEKAVWSYETPLQRDDGDQGPPGLLPEQGGLHHGERRRVASPALGPDPGHDLDAMDHGRTTRAAGGDR